MLEKLKNSAQTQNLQILKQQQLKQKQQLQNVADEIDEDSIYYVELKPTITDGTAYAIFGHFTPENDEEAVDYAIFDLSIEEGKVTDVVDSGFTSSLDGIID